MQDFYKASHEACEPSPSRPRPVPCVQYPEPRDQLPGPSTLDLVTIRMKLRGLALGEIGCRVPPECTVPEFRSKERKSEPA
jgi:hypothetical protein